jgi:ketosteroid isomerase-like protein
MTDDVQEIQKTISTYSYSASVRDWDLMLSTFLPDATWEVAGTKLSLKGHAELRATISKLVEPMIFLVQMHAPAIIEVSGDEARARSLIREAGKMRDSAEWIDIVGTYEDRLVRTPQGWRFLHRTFTPIGRVRMPILPNEKLPFEKQDIDR